MMHQTILSDVLYIFVGVIIISVVLLAIINGLFCYHIARLIKQLSHATSHVPSAKIAWWLLFPFVNVVIAWWLLPTLGSVLKKVNNFQDCRKVGHKMVLTGYGYALFSSISLLSILVAQYEILIQVFMIVGQLPLEPHAVKVPVNDGMVFHVFLLLLSGMCWLKYWQLVRYAYGQLIKQQ